MPMVHRITFEEEVVRCLFCGRVFPSVQQLDEDQECQPSRPKQSDTRALPNGKSSRACSGGFHARCFWNECNQCNCECHSYPEEEEEDQEILGPHAPGATG